MKCKLFIAFVFVLIGFNNMSFAQVNMQDGSITYNIPIYNFTDSKAGLATAINLQYSSGNGLKVNSRASSVGQNWNLLAGGYVIRQQVGEPDDQNSTSTFPIIANPNGTPNPTNLRGFNRDIACYVENYQSFNNSLCGPCQSDTYSRNYYDNYYPNGYMYSEFPVAIEDQAGFASGGFSPKSLAVNIRFRQNQDMRFKIGRNALTDREQDIFTFNLNGDVGQFVIGKNGLPSILNLEKNRYSIAIITENLTAQNIRTRIKEFYIKDDKGIAYKFANYELSEIMEYDELYVEDDNTNFSKRVSGATPKGKFVINKWNLTEIINTNTNEKIDFNYSNHVNDLYNYNDAIPSFSFTNGQNSESVNVNITTNKGTKRNLTSIILPNNNTVEFEYKDNPRQDVEHEKALDKIKVKYNNIEQYHYTFDFGYFKGIELKEYTDYFNETEKKELRLYLKSVKKVGENIAEPAHEFNYYIGYINANISPAGQVPPYSSLAQDHWGYYTTNSNIANTNFNPSKHDLKALLTNAAFRDPSAGTAALGLLRTIKTPLGATINYEYQQNQSKDADYPAITRNSAGVRVYKISTSPNGLSSLESEKTVMQYSYLNADGSSSGWGWESPNYFEQKALKFWNAGNLDGFKYSGKRSQATSGVGSMIANEAFSAALSGATGRVLSLGAKATPVPGLTSLPFVHAMLFSMFMKGFITRVAVFLNPSDNYTTSTYNYFSPQAQNPIGINYARVEEKNISIVSGVGKTVYEFSAPANVRAVILALAIPFAPISRLGASDFGLPLSTKIYNQNETLLKEIQYGYSYVSNGYFANENNKSCKIYVNKYESGGVPNWSIGNGVPASNFNWQYYYPTAVRNQLFNAVEKNYSISGNTSTDIVQTYYNSDYLVSRVVMQKSNNTTIEIRKYYPNDYNNVSSTIIALLKTKNMLNTEIASEKWLIKGTNNFLLEANVNEYKQAQNGEIILSKLYTLQTDMPLAQNIIGLHNPNILIRNSTYFKEQALLSYLPNAVLKETKNTSGNDNVHLFDFGDRVPVATVTNANYDDVAYTSFETNIQGGWQFNTSDVILGNTTTGTSIMGNKYLRFIDGVNVSKQINNSSSYKCSFWSRGSNLYLSFTGNIIAPSLNLVNTATGWTYKEYTLNGSGFLNITKSAIDNTVAYIDELRLYPKNARMASVGYDHLLRKTSDCDVNNRIQFYEYDGLNRIILIRDENRNILKKYCYTFNGQVENCLDITQNQPVWEIQPNSVCEPCPINYNYLSGKRFKFKRDINPASPTYQSIVQYEDINNPCISPPDWVLTDTYCLLQNAPPYSNSGMQQLTYTDINPCSNSYNQTQTQSIANTAACPVCTTPCNEPEYKCINGACIQGTLQIIKVVRHGKNGPWDCYYAYCFPNGITSDVVNVVSSSTACAITCQ